MTYPGLQIRDGGWARSPKKVFYRCSALTNYKRSYLNYCRKRSKASRARSSRACCEQRCSVLLLPRTRVLKPDLCDSFAETCQLRDPLEVLSVRIGVHVKIRLKDLKLFFCKCGPYSFCFVAFYDSPTRRRAFAVCV